MEREHVAPVPPFTENANGSLVMLHYAESKFTLEMGNFHPLKPAWKTTGDAGTVLGTVPRVFFQWSKGF